MTSIPTKALGKNGPQVQRVGFGLMGLSAYYGPPKPDGERLALLDKAYETGQRNWDTCKTAKNTILHKRTPPPDLGSTPIAQSWFLYLQLSQ